jgi:hypothetical protein
VRRAVIDRHTRETHIRVRLGITKEGPVRLRTGIRFLDHMLELMTRHGAFDLEVRASGDLDVDQHHTVEDLGIALGEAVSKASGNTPRHQPRRLFHHADGRDTGRRRRRSGRPSAMPLSIWRCRSSASVIYRAS